MALALDEAQRMNILLPGLALVHQIYQQVQQLGHGQKGTHALMLALEAQTASSPAR
jgi:3-hydroxyisobutyrate dehydrogenase